MTDLQSVSYVWREGDDTPPPPIPPPTSVPCAASTPEDDAWHTCDLYRGHDGPHAEFHFLTGALLAAWTDGSTEP